MLRGIRGNGLWSPVVVGMETVVEMWRKSSVSICR